MRTMHRRNAILVIAASTVTAGGCDTRRIDETIAETSTPVLENTRVTLRGFQIIAFIAGKRLVQLPHPAVRIVGVALVTSAAVTFLVVEYLDIELKKRSTREALNEQERAAIESALAVEFKTENGFSEQVALGPNRYEHPDPDEL